MARTRNTKPWKLRVDPESMSRRKYWTDNGDVRFLSRQYNRQDRHKARADLHREDQPDPVQGRSRALWDAW